mgnify:CR=1 FL=1
MINCRVVHVNMLDKLGTPWAMRMLCYALRLQRPRCKCLPGYITYLCCLCVVLKQPHASIQRVRAVALTAFQGGEGWVLFELM